MDVPLTVEGLGNVALPAERSLHLAIGMFDGVHRGHQTVIGAAREAARRTGGLCGVLTFWPHPSALFRPSDPVPQIMTPATKEEVLRSLGVDVIVEQPFTPAFAAIPAEDFVVRLQKHLPTLAAIYVGENWRFGKGRVGDATRLAELGRALGIEVHSAPRLAHAAEPISSTRIRKLLADGDIALANRLLGYRYFSKSKVRSGKQLGRTLGFPTLNLPWNPLLKPRLGVYAVRASSPETPEAGSLPGVANYGLRPTVETSAPNDPLLEVFLLNDSSPFATGETVRVAWIDFLRPEIRFANVEALQAQIARDVEKARKLFAS